LLDEPLSNLDAKLRLEMRGEIRRICKAFGLTGIYVTHDQAEALSMADRLAVMDAGRLAQVGAPLEVYRNPVNRRVAEFMGETNFIEARVLGPGVAAGTLEVDTVTGQRLARTRIPGWRPAAGDRVWLSVRPEALSFDARPEAQNRFAGEIVDTVYLGSSVQYRLSLQGDVPLKITVMNPSGSLGSPGESAVVFAAADDVMVLPD
jgi:ABC-type Fe3+/spermidine/putrescine transport system ATPase subunit